MTSSRANVLRESFHNLSRDDLQPVFTSLNGDNSWLISFPVPEAALQPTGKAFYHVVSDAWLEGPAIQTYSWLGALSLTTPSAIISGSAIEDVVREIEDAAVERWGRKGGAADLASNTAPMVDAIFCNLHLTDHTHPATLKTFDPDIPVFGTREATAIVKSLNHFKTVMTTKDLAPTNADWKSLHPGAPFPPWLSVFRLTEDHFLQFAIAMVWSSGINLDKHQAVIYSPHGIKAQHPSVQTFCHNLQPHIDVVAILHALKDSFAFGIRTVLGVTGGVALCEETKPKYWIKSHDAMPLYSGLIGKGVWDTKRTLESGVEELRNMRGEKGLKEGFEMPQFVEVGNGESFALV